MPGALTIHLSRVLAPDTIFPPFEASHKTFPPVMFTDPLSVISGERQVSSLSPPAFTVISAFTLETTATSLPEHPVSGSFTVSLYEPEAPTITSALLAPDTITPPFEASHKNIPPAMLADPFSL